MSNLMRNELIQSYIASNLFGELLEMDFDIKYSIFFYLIILLLIYLWKPQIFNLDIENNFEKWYSPFISNFSDKVCNETPQSSTVSCSNAVIRLSVSSRMSASRQVTSKGCVK